MPPDDAEQELLRRKRMIDSGTVPKDEAWAAGGAGVGEIVSHEGSAAFDLGKPATFDTGASAIPSSGERTYAGAAQDTLNSAKEYAGQTYDVASNKAADTYNAAADRLGLNQNTGSGTDMGDRAADTTSKTYDQAADTANTTYGVAADRAGQAYNATADTAGQAYNTAADTATQTYNVAADRTGQAYNATANKAGQVYGAAADTAAQTYNVAADKTGQAYNTVADTAAQTYNVAADKTGQAYNAAADTAAQTYNAAADTAAKTYNTVAGTAAQTYNVAADKAAQTSQATYDTVKPHYDNAVQVTQDTAVAARDKAAQTYSDAKDYTTQTAQSAYQTAQEKTPELIQTTKDTAAAAAVGTAAGTAGIIQGVQEVAGVTPHNPGELPNDSAGQEVVKDETAEAARSNTVSLLSTAGATLAAGAALAGTAIASGAQYAKSAVLGAPNTAGYSDKDNTPVMPSDADESELVRRKRMIESGTVPKDEATVAGGAGYGEILSHEGGSAFPAPPPAAAPHYDTSAAVQVTGDDAAELQHRKDLIASGNVPTEEAGVAAGAGVGEVLSHGDNLGGGEQAVPVSGGGRPGGAGESLFTQDLTAQQNVPPGDEGLVPGGAATVHGDPLTSEAASTGGIPGASAPAQGSEGTGTTGTGGITGYVASFFGSKPASE